MKRLNTRIPGSVPKIRLDEFLSIWLPTALGEPVSKSKIRTLIVGGAAYVNRHRSKNPTVTLYSGAFIEVYYDESVFDRGQPMKINQIRFDPSRILFEDEWIFVVDKPAGLPTQPTVDPRRANLYDLMKQFFNQRTQTENAYVGLHHRLDKDTSGLVLFTKNESANKGVSELFTQKKIKKTYQCLVWRSPAAPRYEVEDHFAIENYLGKINQKNEHTRMGAVSSGGDHAVTQFKVIECFRDVYWLQAEPLTGRTHQIRVHCFENHFPILGDPLYREENIISMTLAPRLMLHAGVLQFIHPITGKTIEVRTPLPDDFMNTLGSLKA